MLRVDDTSHNFHHYWRNIRLIPPAIWDAVEDRAFLGGIALYPGIDDGMNRAVDGFFAMRCPLHCESQGLSSPPWW